MFRDFSFVFLFRDPRSSVELHMVSAKSSTEFTEIDQHVLPVCFRWIDLSSTFDLAVELYQFGSTQIANVSIVINKYLVLPIKKNAVEQKKEKKKKKIAI